MTTSEDRLKLFHMNSALLRRDLEEVERQYTVHLGFDEDSAVEDDAYYLQFPAAIRADAERMAQHYRLFYCLENSIRDLVAATLLSGDAGADWWERKVPQNVRDNVAANVQREQDAGMTLRSPDLIDYTTFGELSGIIQENWDVFSDTFNSKKAIVRILGALNLLRGPIAHCSPLAEDEVHRLRLHLRDWFRLME
jgi:Swt1-like HEPN